MTRTRKERKSTVKRLVFNSDITIIIIKRRYVSNCLCLSAKENDLIIERALNNRNNYNLSLLPSSGNVRRGMEECSRHYQPRREFSFRRWDLEKHFMIWCRPYEFVSEKDKEQFYMTFRLVEQGKHAKKLPVAKRRDSRACFTRATFDG